MAVCALAAGALGEKSALVQCLSLLKGLTVIGKLPFNLVVQNVLHQTSVILFQTSLVTFMFIYCFSVMASGIFKHHLDNYSFRFNSLA